MCIRSSETAVLINISCIYAPPSLCERTRISSDKVGTGWTLAMLPNGISSVRTWRFSLSTCLSGKGSAAISASHAASSASFDTANTVMSCTIHSRKAEARKRHIKSTRIGRTAVYDEAFTCHIWGKTVNPWRHQKMHIFRPKKWNSVSDMVIPLDSWDNFDQ